MKITGDPEGKALVTESAQLMKGYCLSPNCFNFRAESRQFCISCLGKRNAPPKKSPPRNPKVYFIKQGNFVKIGHTTRPIDERLTDLQTGSPEELELIALESGDFLTEQWLHDLFKKQHHRGEWFTLDDELSNYIECLKQGLGIYKTCEIAFTE